MNKETHKMFDIMNMTNITVQGTCRVLTATTPLCSSRLSAPCHPTPWTSLGIKALLYCTPSLILLCWVRRCITTTPILLNPR